jgi:carboxyl-terminal processing protease
LNYADRQRESLKIFTDPKELEKYLDKQGLLNQFIDFTAKKSVKADPEGIKISGNSINIQLKAYIARNILDNKGFYPIWEQLDTTLKYAIEYLKN